MAYQTSKPMLQNDKDILASRCYDLEPGCVYKSCKTASFFLFLKQASLANLEWVYDGQKCSIGSVSQAYDTQKNVIVRQHTKYYSAVLVSDGKFTLFDILWYWMITLFKYHRSFKVLQKYTILCLKTLLLSLSIPLFSKETLNWSKNTFFNYFQKYCSLKLSVQRFLKKGSQINCFHYWY